VLRAERRVGQFARSFALGTELDEERAVARFENGVLELTLPKKQAPPPAASRSPDRSREAHRGAQAAPLRRGATGQARRTAPAARRARRRSRPRSPAPGPSRARGCPAPGRSARRPARARRAHAGPSSSTSRNAAPAAPVPVRTVTRAPRPGVVQRVLDQVGGQLAQHRRVARTGAGSSSKPRSASAAIAACTQSSTPAPPRRPGRSRHARPRCAVASGSIARQRQQLARHPRHPHAGLVGPAHRPLGARPAAVACAPARAASSARPAASSAGARRWPRSGCGWPPRTAAARTAS
jgi:hypothetical protein